jgi:hypothetical protein
MFSNKPLKSVFLAVVVTVLFFAVFADAWQTTFDSSDITTRRNQGRIIKGAIEAVEGDICQIHTGEFAAADTIDTLLITGALATDNYVLTWKEDPGSPGAFWVFKAAAGTLIVETESAVTGTPAFNVHRRPN